MLAMVHKPVKTLLAGEELAAHQRELERVKLLKEEFAQRKRREEELAAVSRLCGVMWCGVMYVLFFSTFLTVSFFASFFFLFFFSISSFYAMLPICFL